MGLFRDEFASLPAIDGANPTASVGRSIFQVSVFAFTLTANRGFGFGIAPNEISDYPAHGRNLSGRAELPYSRPAGARREKGNSTGGLDREGA